MAEKVEQLQAGFLVFNHCQKTLDYSGKLRTGSVAGNRDCCYCVGKVSKF